MKNFKEILKSVGNDSQKRASKRNSGRTLTNHAMMYILEGEGLFEDERTPQRSIKTGTLFYLFPGRWHKFDPLPKTTWTEYWILFDGMIAEQRFGTLLPSKDVVFNIGINEEIIDAFEQLYDLWYFNSPCDEVHLNLLIHRILGTAYLEINETVIHRKNNIVFKAKLEMRNSISRNTAFNTATYAKNEGISYESFRKQFKNETGTGPNQYLLRMKMNRAKSLLLRPDLTIKEVAEKLQFDDPYHFSRLFKNKTGSSPSEYRKALLR